MLTNEGGSPAIDPAPGVEPPPVESGAPKTEPAQPPHAGDSSERYGIKITDLASAFRALDKEERVKAGISAERDALRKEVEQLKEAAKKQPEIIEQAVAAARKEGDLKARLVKEGARNVEHAWGLLSERLMGAEKPEELDTLLTEVKASESEGYLFQGPAKAGSGPVHTPGQQKPGAEGDAIFEQYLKSKGIKRPE